MMSLCLPAISTGKPKGDIGFFDYNSVSFDLLNEALSACEECVNCNTDFFVSVKLLYDSCIAIKNLRTSFLDNNWTQISEFLAIIETTEIGSNISLPCKEEIIRYEIERDNYELFITIKNAIIDEKIIQTEGVIEKENICIDQLNNALNLYSIFDDKHKGRIIQSLYSVADIVLKTRRSIMQESWFAAQSMIPLLKDELKQCKTLVDGGTTKLTRRASTLQKSVLVRSNSQRTTSPNVSVSSNFADSGVDEKPQAAAIAKDLTPLHNSILQEIKIIEQHFEIENLEPSIIQALTTKGITHDMIGNIDAKLIDISEIDKILSRKIELENENCTFSPLLNQLFHAADFIRQVRNAIINNEWEKLPVYLEAEMTGNFSGHLPESSRLELHVNYV